MTLKSIEKHLANHSFFSNPWLADMIADIEAEIAERYMLLPLDADGVPIHLGDAVAERPYRPNLGEKCGEVVCLLLNSDGWSVSDRDPFGQWWHPATLIHANPRTLTDVLCDLFERRMTVTDAEHELCELLGGDAR